MFCIHKKSLLKSVKQYVKKGNIDLYSFDIFDTLITRTTIKPTGIFLLIQNTLFTDDKYKNIPAYVKNNFYNIRIDAEKFLNANHGITKRKPFRSKADMQTEFSLEEIYHVIQINYNLCNSTIKELIELELQTEYNNILPIKDNIEVIKYLLSENKRVVLVSDMYLPEDFIRKLLIKCDEVFNDIPIYVSSKYNARKCNEELYGIVKTVENIDYRKWLHVGDDKKVDIKIAQKQRIRTIHVPKEPLTKLEKRILSKNVNNPYYQVFVGITRYIRLLNPDNNIADFAGIVSNILFPYAKWIIDTAIERGYTRLYFIARDGYIIKIFADAIIQQEKLNIQTKYIYGSRKAWKLPCVESFEDLFFAFRIPTVNAIAKALNLNLEELLQFLPASYKNNKNSSMDGAVFIYNYLKKNKKFISFVLEKNKEQRKLLIEYLNQEIDFSNDKFAFVDSIASQETQDLLGKLIIKEMQMKPTTFFYACANNYDSEYMDKCIFQLEFQSTMVELFTKAPHGQVKEYKKENDKIVPICFKETKSDYIHKYLCMVDFCGNIYAKVQKENNLISLNRLGKDYVENIVKYPSHKIAKYFKYLSYEHEGVTGKNEDTKLTIKNLYEISALKTKYYDPDIFRLKICASRLHVRIFALIFKVFNIMNLTKIENKIRKTRMCINHKFY